MKHKIIFALLFSVFGFTLTGMGQAKHNVQLGVSLTPEQVSDGNGFVIGYGLTFDYNFNKHIGIETGAFWRAYKKTYAGTVGGQFIKVEMEDYNISVPVMFRYNSEVINVALGPSFDIYTGYKQLTNKDVYNLKYEPKSKFSLGAQGKISKSIWVSENLVFEPEVRIGVVFPTERAYLGLGLTFKYGF